MNKSSGLQGNYEPTSTRTQEKQAIRQGVPLKPLEKGWVRTYALPAFLELHAGL